MLTRVWTFSVPMDISNHMDTSYMQSRIRLHWNGHALNFHLLAIPILSRHTGEQIFLRIAKALDLLAPGWEKMVVSISNDCLRKVTGRIQSVASRIEQAALSGFSAFGVFFTSMTSCCSASLCF